MEWLQLPEPFTVDLWPVPCWQLVQLGSNWFWLRICGSASECQLGQLCSAGFQLVLTKDLWQRIRVSGDCGSLFLVGTNKGRKLKQRSSFFAKTDKLLWRRIRFEAVSLQKKKGYCDNGLYSWTDASTPKQNSHVQAIWIWQQMLSGAMEEAHDGSSINRQQDSEGDERKGGCIFIWFLFGLLSLCVCWV